jgi:argininosuccinate synthase
MTNQKAILLFSGGLDTSFCVLYLKEQGYDVITLAIDSGGFSQGELEYIENRSKELGAIKHYTIDITQEVFDKFITKIIKANGLYQGEYPLMCSDRLLFGKKAINFAFQEQATVIAHGCTASGNDQFRIEAPILCSGKDIKIITPIKDLGITRDEEIAYLENKGFTVPKEVKKYTLNENILGITLSGSEVDDNQEIPEDTWKLSAVTSTEPEYVEIEFENGLPCTLNNEKMPAVQILKLLNKIAGSHGYGRGLYVEDEILGIKGRQAFEAPGMMLLIKAHKSLEKLVLTKEQLCLKNQMDYKWAELAYAKMFAPVVKNIFSLIDSMQHQVNGKVKLKLSNKSAFLCSVSSPNELIDESIATYVQHCTWQKKDVTGFMKFYTLQSKIFHKKNKQEAI